MDALALDWRVSMKSAREVLGPKRVLCGNVDPMILYGSDAQISQGVRQCIADAGEPMPPFLHKIDCHTLH